MTTAKGLLIGMLKLVLLWFSSVLFLLLRLFPHFLFSRFVEATIWKSEHVLIQRRLWSRGHNPRWWPRFFHQKDADHDRWFSSAVTLSFRLVIVKDDSSTSQYSLFISCIQFCRESSVWYIPSGFQRALYYLFRSLRVGFSVGLELVLKDFLPFGSQFN